MDQSPKIPPTVSNPFRNVPHWTENEHSRPKVRPERKRADSDSAVPDSPGTAIPKDKYRASEPTFARFRPPQALQPGVLPLPLATRTSKSSENGSPPRSSNSSEDVPARASSSSKAQGQIKLLEKGSSQKEILEILKSIDEIPHQVVKLDVLKELVSRINATFDSRAAAELIAHHVEPMARHFAASIDFAPASKVGVKVRELYAAIKMPIEPVLTLSAQVMSAAQEPAVREPEPVVRPQPRMWVSEDVLGARTKIAFLQRGNTPAEFEVSCQSLLTIVDRIGKEHDKLDVLILLVAKINECSASDPRVAGRIFFEEVHRRATELAATVAENSDEDTKLGVLFEAISAPMELYLESLARR